VDSPATRRSVGGAAPEQGRDDGGGWLRAVHPAEGKIQYPQEDTDKTISTDKMILALTNLEKPLTTGVQVLDTLNKKLFDAMKAEKGKDKAGKVIQVFANRPRTGLLRGGADARAARRRVARAAAAPGEPFPRRVPKRIGPRRAAVAESVRDEVPGRFRPQLP